MEFAVVEGWQCLLGEWRYQLGSRNAEELASVRSFARSKGSSAVNHLPNFSYAIALVIRRLCVDPEGPRHIALSRAKRGVPSFPSSPRGARPFDRGARGTGMLA